MPSWNREVCIAYMRLRGWRGLRWRTRKPLANCPLLRWGQIGVVVAGRLLGGSEAGAADDPEGDYACANELVHDCPLMADGVSQSRLSARHLAPIARLYCFDKSKKSEKR